MKVLHKRLVQTFTRFVVCFVAGCARLNHLSTAAEWDELPGLSSLPHRAVEVVLSDTYCEECAVYYRQLLTYGQLGQGLGGRLLISRPLRKTR
jgi:hypothetical protein